MIDPQLMQFLQQIHQRNGQVDGLPGLPGARPPVQMAPQQQGGQPPSMLNAANQLGILPQNGALQAASSGGLPALGNYAAANAADATASNFAAPSTASGLGGIMSFLSGLL